MRRYFRGLPPFHCGGDVSVSRAKIASIGPFTHQCGSKLLRRVICKNWIFGCVIPLIIHGAANGHVYERVAPAGSQLNASDIVMKAGLSPLPKTITPPTSFSILPISPQSIFKF